MQERETPLPTRPVHCRVCTILIGKGFEEATADPVDERARLHLLAVLRVYSSPDGAPRGRTAQARHFVTHRPPIWPLVSLYCARMSGLAPAVGDRAWPWGVTEMASRVLWSCRLLVAAFAALAIVASAPGGASARVTFDATGTVQSKNSDKEEIVLITDVLGKPNQPITIDMSSLSNNFIALRVGQSVTIEIAARESNSYKAYSIINRGQLHRSRRSGRPGAV